MKSIIVRERFGADGPLIDGTGVKIGVISDSYNANAMQLHRMTWPRAIYPTTSSYLSRIWKTRALTKDGQCFRLFMT